MPVKKRPEVRIGVTLYEGEANLMKSYYGGRVKKIQVGSGPRDYFFRILKPLSGPFRKSGKY